MMELLGDLNAEQHRAATAANGPLLIIAGPGTGKTKTLTSRIAHQIVHGGTDPGSILALTFTNKAAEEMRSRVAGLLPPEARRTPPHIATFHALAHRLLGRGAAAAFVSDVQRLQIIKALKKPPELKGVSARELGLLISRIKNGVASDSPEVKKLVRAYNKALLEQGLQDFDDLLLNLHEQLKTDAEAREAVQHRYAHVLVDEFQDTNALQYALLKLVLGHDNLFVIGDPKQSIYGFRGADGDIFGQFAADYPDHTAITLATNYRSAPEVVRLSNAIFSDTPLTPAVVKPGRVRAVQVLNEYGEADWVVGEIQREIGGGDFTRAVSDDARHTHRRLSDFAILYRSRAAAAAVQKAVSASGLPFQVVGDGSPYEAPQVQVVIALIKAAAAGERVQLEGFTAAECRMLDELIAEGMTTPPASLARKLITTLGFEPSAALSQLTGTLVRFENVYGAAEYFEELAGQQFYDPTADVITLLTIHAAKGLEFPVVFLVGAEEGVLPSTRGDSAEERRLFYVAATRAGERLEITHAKNRGGQPAGVSRFITELPPEVLERTADPGMQEQARRIAKKAAKRSQQSLF